MKPVVAIVGRPNVGKSTLFNRLVGKPMAIVSDIPGTTRDRIFADITVDGHDIVLVDTGGLEPKPETSIARKIRNQVETAIEEADAIVFLLDAIDGLTNPDLDIADKLRRIDKPILTVVNKVDSEKADGAVGDFYRLGTGDVVPVSAYHRRNIASFKETLAALLPEAPPTLKAPGGEAEVKIALVGRPGVGKSTILNTLLGKERAIVGDVPGTTRDALDTIIQFKEHRVHLIDTGGIRQRGRTGMGVSFYSLIRTIRAIDQCDVAVLVIDAEEVITAQDMHVAQYILEAEKGAVVVVNKTDLIPKGSQPFYAAKIERRLEFMAYAPVLYTSAKIGKNIAKILPEAIAVWRERGKKLPDSEVNAIIKQAVVAHPPPHRGLKRINVYGGFQAGTNPPAFVILANEPKLIHFSYQRYLDNRLREAFAFGGTPIRLMFRKKAKSADKGAT